LALNIFGFELSFEDEIFIKNGENVKMQYRLSA